MKATLPSVAMIALTCSGCVYALNKYNQPYDTAIRIQSQDPEQYMVHVDADGGSIQTNANGTISVHVPRLPRACDVIFLGVPLTSRNGVDRDVIHVRKGTKLVKKLSINDLRNLPQDAEGVGLVKMK